MIDLSQSPAAGSSRQQLHEALSANELRQAFSVRELESLPPLPPLLTPFYSSFTWILQKIYEQICAISQSGNANSYVLANVFDAVMLTASSSAVYE